MENLGKAVDTWAVRFITFTLLLIWFDYILGNFWGALAISLPTTILLIVITKKIIEKNNWKIYPKNKLYTQMALLGNTYTLGLYADINKIEYDKKQNFCTFDNTLYFCAFRFSSLTADDVATAYRQSLAEKTDKTVIICNKVSRDVMTLAATLYDDYLFVTAADMYKLLKKNDALPPLLSYKTEKDKSINTFSGLFDVVFSTNNAKYYLFSGILLALMTFVTPLKTYYIITASISLLFALFSKVRG